MTRFWVQYPSATIAYNLSFNTTGETEKFQWHGQMGYVHIDDVARTHILVFEHEAAQGRYICSSNVISLEELVSFLSARYPSLPIPKRFGTDL